MTIPYSRFDETTDYQLFKPLLSVKFLTNLLYFLQYY